MTATATAIGSRTGEIPAPPRDARWRSCLARCWAVGMIGAQMLVLGLVLFLVFAAVGDAPESSQTIALTVACIGGAALGYWYRAVLKVRIMLREGFLARGKITLARVAWSVRPPHVKLRYRFADQQGVEHDGQQFVRAASPLGRRILSGQEGASVHVIYEPYDPRMSRVVGPEDFLESSPAVAGEQESTR